MKGRTWEAGCSVATLLFLGYAKGVLRLSPLHSLALIQRTSDRHTSLALISSDKDFFEHEQTHHHLICGRQLLIFVILNFSFVMASRPLAPRGFSLKESHLSTEGWYGDVDSPRQIDETLIRSLALQIAVVIAFGHLLSLRQISNRWWLVSLLSIIIYILFPTLPVAQLIRNTLSALWRARCKRVNLAFSLGVSFGMYAATTSGSLPMLHFEVSALRRNQKRHDAWFIGRILALLVLLTQLTGTLFLWVRRASVYGGPYRLWAIDNRNLEVASCSIVVVFISIAIQCINSTWEMVDVQPFELDPQQPQQGPALNPESGIPGTTQLPRISSQLTLTVDPGTNQPGPSPSRHQRRTMSTREFIKDITSRTSHLYSKLLASGSRILCPIPLPRIMSSFATQWALLARELQLDLELATYCTCYFTPSSAWLEMKWGQDTDGNTGACQYPVTRQTLDGQRSH